MSICVAIPEMVFPDAHTVRFGCVIGQLHFEADLSRCVVKTVDSTIIRLDTPKLVAMPSETVGAVAWGCKALDDCATSCGV